MAARPLLRGLTSAARSRVLALAPRSSPRRFIYPSAPALASPVASPSGTSSATVTPSPSSAFPAMADQTEDMADARHAAFLGEADSNDGHDVHQEVYGAPPVALDAKHAAFLGEADSDDGFEALKVQEGDRYEALDARHAAFLGEADSDDGFEVRRMEEGDRHEPVDATNAAFLGEADSDDGFEVHVELFPDMHRHRIEDTAASGFHGERGEMDSNERVV